MLIIFVEEGAFVEPLYKQLIHIESPTLAFIGLCFRVRYLLL